MDGKTAGPSQALASQNPPKTKLWRFVLILFRNPSVLQTARTIRGKWCRWVLDRRDHRRCPVIRLVANVRFVPNIVTVLLARCPVWCD